MIEFGYKEHKCECCGMTEWLGGSIPLELHHKNGDGKDFTLDNLVVLCPNCHTLTDNYGWKDFCRQRRHYDPDFQTYRCGSDRSGIFIVNGCAGQD